MFFFQHPPRKGFNIFVQSVVDTRREEVVAETMKLLGNSSYGYQIMDRSTHTITKRVNDEKTLEAINEPLFKRLNTVEKDLYEVYLLKSTIEHREPIIVGFFTLHYAKMRILELYYNFFDKFYEVNKFEKLEIDTDSFYLALVEKKLIRLYSTRKKRHLGKKRENDCRDSFKADAKSKFFPQTLLHTHKKHNKRESALFKEEFRCTEIFVCVAKLVAAIISS